MAVTIKESIFDAEGNISIVKSTDEIIDITIQDGSGVAIDITGYTIFFTVKSNPTDLDIDAQIDTTATLTDPTNGIAQISLTDDDTDLSVDSDSLTGVYWYDIKIKDTTGKVVAIRRKKFTVTQNIKQGVV